MRLSFSSLYTENPRVLLRRCGYGEQMTRAGVSYARRLGGNLFPRFHVYIQPAKKAEDGFELTLHLDQKAACYGGASAHSGEYDSELVAQEGERIRAHIATYAASIAPRAQE